MNLKFENPSCVLAFPLQGFSVGMVQDVCLVVVFSFIEPSYLMGFVSSFAVTNVLFFWRRATKYQQTNYNCILKDAKRIASPAAPTHIVAIISQCGIIAHTGFFTGADTAGHSCSKLPKETQRSKNTS